MEIVFLRQFSKDLEKLPLSVRRRIANVITIIEQADSLDAVPHSRQLKGHPHAFRIRLGDYRIGIFHPPVNRQN